MSAHTWCCYVPPWAPAHVRARYTEPVFEDGARQEQRIEMSCLHCGDSHRLTCQSGQVRVHIAGYARAHLHAPAFKPAPKR